MKIGSMKQNCQGLAGQEAVAYGEKAVKEEAAVEIKEEAETEIHHNTYVIYDECLKE